MVSYQRMGKESLGFTEIPFLDLGPLQHSAAQSWGSTLGFGKMGEIQKGSDHSSLLEPSGKTQSSRTGPPQPLRGPASSSLCCERPAPSTDQPSTKRALPATCLLPTQGFFLKGSISDERCWKRAPKGCIPVFLRIVLCGKYGLAAMPRGYLWLVYGNGRGWSRARCAEVLVGKEKVLLRRLWPRDNKIPLEGQPGWLWPGPPGSAETLDRLSPHWSSAALGFQFCSR